VVRATMAGRDLRVSRQPHHEHREVSISTSPPSASGTTQGDVFTPRGRSARSTEAPLRGEKAHGRHDAAVRRGIWTTNGSRMLKGLLIGSGSLGWKTNLKGNHLTSRAADLARTRPASSCPDYPGRASIHPDCHQSVWSNEQNATASRTKTKPLPLPPPLPGDCRQVLRVNLSTGKIWTQPWAEPRRVRGGVAIGDKILYEEVGPRFHWDLPATGHLATAPGRVARVGHGGLSVVTAGRPDQRRHLDPGNGVFGAALKYSGYGRP